MWGPNENGRSLASLGVLYTVKSFTEDVGVWEVKSTWHCGASKWAFMVSFRLRVEGQMITLCVKYRDKGQLP